MQASKIDCCSLPENTNGKTSGPVSARFLAVWSFTYPESTHSPTSGSCRVANQVSGRPRSSGGQSHFAGLPMVISCG